MANACGLFGDLIPNIYIDRVFLEEALQDTNNDGIADIQTPTISVNLKVVDTPSANGTFSILGAKFFNKPPNLVSLNFFFSLIYICLLSYRL